MTQDNTSLLNVSIDDILKNTNLGSINKAIGDNIYGINHRQIPTAVPDNKDSYGLTFFTRPQLNLQTSNIRNVREFYSMLTDNILTPQIIARCLLDPRLINGYRFGAGSKAVSIPPIKNPLVDNRMAFISILTNNLKSMSGWPDMVTPTFTSKNGLYNEVYTQVDGVVRNYGQFDIDATFRNTKGDPIIYMMAVWQLYSSLVSEGIIIPYLDFMTENEQDYNTRIYRLVLDKNKNIVTKIAATGVSTPISSPMGSFFDFNDDKPFNDQNRDFTIRFNSIGAIYQDDILVYEFNKVVTIFNPDMSDNLRSSSMVKIPREILTIFNNRGYPRINPRTYELEWWIDINVFNSKTGSFLNNNLLESVPEPDNETGDG